ncbi:hypothetical protein KP509_23G081100 [Ceratopteris richardii]|uniref:DNA-directed RNA polymerase n=1 Tax=Ceratopteris richardii TaxID=49495 RepID=A0A8T2S2C8_CERRI|nr:hypothetical protein KP509_23G081100 [Ceratopteris richardii]
MIHRTNYKQLRIGLASPEQILTWAEQKLPNGDIVGQTHKPERDGSFCERIFGPIKSGVCACGNYQSINNEDTSSTFCKQCGVEFTDSQVRRYQMGYIKLVCPVTHGWFSKRVPSYIANSLAKPLKELESLLFEPDEKKYLCPILGGQPTYPNLFLARPVAERPTLLRLRGLFNYEDRSWKNILPIFFSTRNYETLQKNEIATRADAIKKGLASLDLHGIVLL